MELNKLVSPYQIKIFVLSLVPVFLMVALPYLGIRAPGIIVSPEPQKREVMDEIKPKLEMIKNNFQIKKRVSLVEGVYAGASFEEAEAYGVINLDTGEILLEKNLSKQLPIASLTKIMTAVVALDLANVKEDLTVSREASNQVPTKVMLKEGEEITLEKLLKSLLISSANDSAQAIEDGIDQKYGQEVFIQSMNQKAKIIGLKNSHFTNPQGLDNPNHYSSVEDLSLLSQYALQNYPFIKEVAAKEFEDLTGGLDERFYLRNWNGLLGVYPGTYGIKTGNTEDAGHTTVVVAEREGQSVLVVILGTPGVLERDLWTSQLLDSGFSKLGVNPVNITEAALKEKYNTWAYYPY